MTIDEAIQDWKQTVQAHEGGFIPPISAWAEMCGVSRHKMEWRCTTHRPEMVRFLQARRDYAAARGETYLRLRAEGMSRLQAQLSAGISYERAYRLEPAKRASWDWPALWAKVRPSLRAWVTTVELGALLGVPYKRIHNLRKLPKWLQKGKRGNLCIWRDKGAK